MNRRESPVDSDLQRPGPRHVIARRALTRRARQGSLPHAAELVVARTLTAERAARTRRAGAGILEASVVSNMRAHTAAILRRAASRVEAAAADRCASALAAGRLARRLGVNEHAIHLKVVARHMETAFDRTPPAGPWIPVVITQIEALANSVARRPGIVRLERPSTDMARASGLLMSKAGCYLLARRQLADVPAAAGFVQACWIEGCLQWSVGTRAASTATQVNHCQTQACPEYRLVHGWVIGSFGAPVAENLGTASRESAVRDDVLGDGSCTCVRRMMAGSVRRERQERGRGACSRAKRRHRE